MLDSGVRIIIASAIFFMFLRERVSTLPWMVWEDHLQCHSWFGRDMGLWGDLVLLTVSSFMTFILYNEGKIGNTGLEG